MYSMRNIKATCTVLLIVGWILPLQAQVFPLDSVFVYIEKNNPMLQLYGAKIDALNSYSDGAKNWDPPKVGTGFWMTPYNPNLWKSDGQTDFQGMGSYMVSVEQMIPNRQKLKAKQHYMQAMSSAEIENRSYLKNQLFAEAKSNYYECIILKKKRGVLREGESIMNMMIQSAEAHYTYNKEKLNTIYKAKAQLASIQNSILMTENEIQQKGVALNTLMNRNKNFSFDVDTSYQIKNYEINRIDTAHLQQNRSDLKSIDRSAAILKFKQAMERVKNRPDFGLSYAHMFSFGQQPNVFTLMGTVTIPIAPWASKEYKANIRGIDFEIAELKWQKQAAINDITGKMNSISVAIKSAKQQLKIYNEHIIPALNNNLKTSQLAYEQNKEELFVVLDAWAALNMAKLESLNEMGELLKLQVNYERELEKQ